MTNKTISRRLLLSCGMGLAALPLALATLPAHAQQDYPNKPIRIIVPYPSGGSVDAISRIVGRQLETVLKQAVVIDNRPGASGGIGMNATARSAPDGYTFVICTVGALTINAHLNDLNYDPFKDFVPVSQLVTSALFITANPAFPPKNIPELIAYAKEHPGKLSYSVTGASSQTFLAGKLLEKLSGTQMTAVPYKGGPPAATAIASGEVPFGITDTGPILPYLSSDKVRPLALTYSKRKPGMPDIPTVSETFPEFNITTWMGMFAPAGTPPEIVEKVNAAIGQLLRDPAVKVAIENTEHDPAPSTSAELASMLKADYELYGRILKDAGLSKQ
ncbi:MAG: tripartite tricarboxylate transporter substrate binding protein [Pigmentiphaga sp.]|nr:tripartite tricarboxylate transporter substrate binding protein [Pigmentiphaga sp.]